jgi:hypothetical protein
MKFNAEELKRARDEFTIAAQWCNDILHGEKKPTRANIESCLNSANQTAGEGIRRLGHILPPVPVSRAKQMAAGHDNFGT